MAGRWLSSRLGPRALILGYHRVAEPAADRHRLCVSPANFAAQLAVLGQRASVISLEALLAELKGGGWTSGSVAITFDDGYADVLATAAPLLAEAGMAASLFVASDFLDGRFSWDEGDREAAALSRPELVELAGSPGWTIGAHSASHPALAGLPVEAQRREVVASRACLEGIVGRPVRHFSYPHGSVDAATAAVVRAAGFASACASGPDVVRRGSDPFQLPRLWPGDWDGDRFGRWLRHWLV
ncbi:MAG: polysaccharide deacetylase family protein [Candidatus Promineifilaceae bacterium]